MIMLNGEKYPKQDFDLNIDELDLSEIGKSKELLSNELYMPVHPSRGWIRCCISLDQSGSYRLYLEGNKKRFVLSAKQYPNGSFIISPFEDFPTYEKQPNCGVVARVELQRDNSYLVCLEKCHLCDNILGKYTCGRGKQEREVIAKIVQYVKCYQTQMQEIDFRNIHVSIPSVSKTGTRKIWCPRSFRKIDNKITNDKDVNSILTDYPSLITKCFNKPPEWNDTLNNLVLKFQGAGRILSASTKNFLLYEERKDFPKFKNISNSTGSSMDAKKKKMKKIKRIEKSNGGSMIYDKKEKKLSDESKKNLLDAKNLKLNNMLLKQQKHLTLEEMEGQEILNNNETNIDDLRSNSKDSQGGKKRKDSWLGLGKSKNFLQKWFNGNSNKVEDYKIAVIQTESTKTKLTKKPSTEIIELKRSQSANSGIPTVKSKTKSEISVESSQSSRSSSSFNSDKDSDRAILQFGKSSPMRYILDFRFPLSPIQAFGISLSTFPTNSDEDLKIDTPEAKIRKSLKKPKNFEFKSELPSPYI